MASFTAADIKNLREMTGVGMMDCKKALTESDGDMDKVVAWLREKGLAAEGMSYAAVIDGVGVVVEVNAESDFVAKNELFVAYVKGIAEVVAKENPADLDALMGCQFPGTGRTVKEEQNDKVLVIGENINVRRFARYADGLSVPYIHAGGKIGVLVNMEVSENLAGNDAVVELGKDVAMQIAAMNPSFLDKADVDQATLDKEKEILMAQAIEENKNAAKPKPEAIIEKMVMGRVGKYYEENCLLQQAFVKENKISVEKHIAEVAKQVGGSIKVTGFIRFATGEGIEKRQDDLAAEVEKLVNNK